MMVHRGTWSESEQYKRGDVTTHDGSAFCALVETKGAMPGKSSDWQLIVKRGRDGRDAKTVRVAL